MTFIMVSFQQFPLLISYEHNFVFIFYFFYLLFSSNEFDSFVLVGRFHNTGLVFRQQLFCQRVTFQYLSSLHSLTRERLVCSIQIVPLISKQMDEDGQALKILKAEARVTI